MTTAATMALWAIALGIGLLVVLLASLGEAVRKFAEAAVTIGRMLALIASSQAKLCDTQTELKDALAHFGEADHQRAELFKQSQAELEKHMVECSEWHGLVREGIAKVLKQNEFVTSTLPTSGRPS